MKRSKIRPRFVGTVLALVLLASNTAPTLLAGAEAPAPAETGALVIVLWDAEGLARGGACFLVIDAVGAETSICDEDGDGRSAAEGIAAGLAAVKPIAPAAGCAGETGGEVEIAAGGETWLELTDACEPLAPPEPTPEPVAPTPTHAPETPAPTTPPVSPALTAEATGTPLDPTPTAPPPTPSPAAPEAGDLAVTLMSSTFGMPSLRACFTLIGHTTGNEGTTENGMKRCDGDDGLDDGVTRFTAIPRDQYDVLQHFAFRDNPAPKGTAQVQVGTTASITLWTQPLGTILVRSEDEFGAGTLVGGCFEAWSDSKTGVEWSAQACDGDDHVVDGTVIIPFVPWHGIGLRNLEAPYLPDPQDAAVIQQPYLLAPDGGAFLDAGQHVTVITKHRPRLGSIEVLAAGDDGPVPGACFQLNYPASSRFYRSTVDLRCDRDDGADDGRTRFEDVAMGSYLIRLGSGWGGQTFLGAYELADPTNNLPVTVDGATPDLTVEVAFLRMVGSLEIQTLDAGRAGAPVEACYAVYHSLNGGKGSQAAQACDGGNGDADPSVGVVRVDRLDQGEYVLTQSWTAENWVTTQEIPVTIAKFQVTAVAVEDRFAPVGTIRATVVDASGASTLGACIEVLEDGSVVCDTGVSDVGKDGVVNLYALTPGSYTLRAWANANRSTPLAIADVSLSVTTRVETSVTLAPGSQVEILDIAAVNGRDVTTIVTGACYRVVAYKVLGRYPPPKLADVQVCDRNGHARVKLPLGWDSAEVTVTTTPTGYTSDTSATVVGRTGMVTAAVIHFWKSL